MSAFLKFRYFLLLALMVSCGDRTAQTPSQAPAEKEQTTETPISTAGNVILFFGDSLTAGYGLETEQAFPALLGHRLDSLGYPYQVVNAGLSGETTAGGRNRLDWILRQEVAVFVLELGANDGLRGIPLSETRANLTAIIQGVRSRYPEAEIVLAGMQLPPNMGPEYTSEFRTLFPEIAAEEGVALIPFLLKGVGGVPELNQQDGIHPTAEGHRILAENVWTVLQPLLSRNPS